MKFCNFALFALLACGVAPATPALAQRTPPAPMPMGRLEFPAFREVTLPGGLPVVVVERRGQPVANVSLFVRSGSAAVPEARAGLTDLLASVLTKGTQTRNATQVAEAIENVGGSLNAFADQDFVQVNATVLADNLPLAMELVSDVALRPTFPENELEIARKRLLSGLQVQLSQPGPIAQRALSRALYGSAHPYAFAAVPRTVQGITRADLQQFHQQNFKAGNALLVVSGDVSAARVEEMARRHFAALPAGTAPAVSFPQVASREAPQVILVHRPGSVQSNLLIGNPGIRPGNPDYYPLVVANKILGGGSDARLFAILREQRGWTYGSYSQLSRPRELGTFVASAEVRTEVTDSALAELLNQLRRLRDEPVTQQELEAAKGFLVGSFPLTIETPGQIASQVARTRLLGLPVTDITQRRERLAAVTIQDVQRVAREYVQPGRATIVVVGDATRILPGVRRVVPNVQVVNLEGEPVDPAALKGS